MVQLEDKGTQARSEKMEKTLAGSARADAMDADKCQERETDLEDGEDILLDADAILALSDSDDPDEFPLLQTITESDEEDDAGNRVKKNSLTKGESEDRDRKASEVYVPAETVPRASAFTAVSGNTFRPVVPTLIVLDVESGDRSAGSLLAKPTAEEKFQSVVDEYKQTRENGNRVGLDKRGGIGYAQPSMTGHKDSFLSPGILNGDSSSLVVRRHSFGGTAKDQKSKDELREHRHMTPDKQQTRAVHRRPPLITIQGTLSSSDSESEKTQSEAGIVFNPTKNAVHRTGLWGAGDAMLEPFSGKTKKVTRRYSIAHTREAHKRVLENINFEKSHFVKERNGDHRRGSKPPLSPSSFTHTSNRQRRKASVDAPNMRLLQPHPASPADSPRSKSKHAPPTQGGLTIPQQLDTARQRRASSIIPPRRDTALLSPADPTSVGVDKTKRRTTSCPPPVTLSSSHFMFGDDNWDDGKSFDHYLMTMHLMTDPGEADKVKQLLQPLIDLIIPKLKVFNIVERDLPENAEVSTQGTTPSTGVVLFLQEDFGLDRILQAQKYFFQSPWQLHHRDRLGTNIVSIASNNQDFYFFSLGMPLWGIRQVHGGRDILRFMLFVSDGNWEDTIHLYTTLLGKDVRLNRNGFCFFTVFRSNAVRLEIQLALKRLPPGLRPRVSESSMLQFKVEEIGQMVPLLPHSCTPISERRWQTTDYDGNRVLLLVAPIHGAGNQDSLNVANAPTKKRSQQQAAPRRSSLVSVSSAYESAAESLPQSKTSTPPSSLSSHSYHSASENSGGTDTSDDENVLYI